MKAKILFTACFLALGATAYGQNAPSLIMPVDCTLGEDCEIQQFVDHDPSEGVRDFGCGTASYDGHKGTDFRVTEAHLFSQGVPVIAAADGTVLGLRDEMSDRLVRTAEDNDAVQGRECGNGLVIDHGFGWQTQYCHMRLGSLVVKKRQKVKAGDVLGMIGLSGRTQFPHLHLTVRHRNVVIDPFTGKSQNESCSVKANNSLWADTELAEWSYQPTRVIDLGLANERVTGTQIEQGIWDSFRPSASDPLLISYVRLVNVRKDDVVKLYLLGPEGLSEERTFPPMEKNRAQQMVFHGIKKPRSGWPAGTYKAQTVIERHGEILIDQTFDVVSRE